MSSSVLLEEEQQPPASTTSSNNYQSDFENLEESNNRNQQHQPESASSSLVTQSSSADSSRAASHQTQQSTTATTRESNNNNSSSSRQSSVSQNQNQNQQEQPSSSQQQQQQQVIHPASSPIRQQQQQLSSPSSPSSSPTRQQQQHQQKVNYTNSSTTSFQQFLYQNGKSPLPFKSSTEKTLRIHDYNSNNNTDSAMNNSSFTNQNQNRSNTNQSYSAPEPLPFGSPVPLSQQLGTLEGNNTQTTFYIDNNANLNAASRTVYTATITKLRTQLQECQRNLNAKQVECESIRNEMTQRERDGNSRMHSELKTRVDSEVTTLNREHNRQLDALRSHYEDMIEQLHGRVKNSENEAEELRLRVATMTTKVTEAQSSSQRDKQNLEASQRRFESELQSLKERHHEEVEHMKKEIDLTRSSVDGRDQVSFSQVASLQSDVRRLQSELENTRNHASRLQAERDEDNRRNREDRDALQRECDGATRRATDRAKNAEANEREALDKTLRAERQLSEERARRERLTEELTGVESKEHETQRVLARKEAEIARLEARIESLQVKANTFANEAAAVRHEFDVRDSRDRAQEKLQFEQKLVTFRERTELKSLPAAPAYLQQHQSTPMEDHLNSSSSHHQQQQQQFSTPLHQQQQQQYHPSLMMNNSSNHSHSSSTAAQRALQEVMDATVSEMKDLKRSLSLIPQNEYSRRAPAIENRIESCLDEIKRLNERVSRTEASQVRFAQNANQNTSAAMMMRGQQSNHQRPPLVQPQSNISIRHNPATVDYSPSMKKVKDLRDALNQ